MHADGQLFAVHVGEPAWERDAWDTRQVGGDGVDVVHVHLQRVIGHLADLERRAGRCRAEDRIARLERGVKVPGDETPCPQCQVVVLLVVAGGQRVRAQHDAAFYFCAKSLSAGLTIEVHDRVFAGGRGGLGPVAVVHAVVPREVGRALSGRHDVVAGDAVLRMRQINLDDLRAGLLVDIHRLLKCRGHGRGIDTILQVLLSDTDP